MHAIATPRLGLAIKGATLRTPAWRLSISSSAILTAARDDLLGAID
jgi:hypothetical protein